mmetsp:Transcript_98752/g.137103  ORF Transcript_98752/g.137103 Transcript_98752/m.137103 type:complete len:304 (-) Transcript_98752:54-965(-)
MSVFKSKTAHIHQLSYSLSLNLSSQKLMRLRLGDGGGGGILLSIARVSTFLLLKIIISVLNHQRSLLGERVGDLGPIKADLTHALQDDGIILRGKLGSLSHVAGRGKDLRGLGRGRGGSDGGIGSISSLEQVKGNGRDFLLHLHRGDVLVQDALQSLSNLLPVIVVLLGHLHQGFDKQSIVFNAFRGGFSDFVVIFLRFRALQREAIRGAALIISLRHGRESAGGTLVQGSGDLDVAVRLSKGSNIVHQGLGNNIVIVVECVKLALEQESSKEGVGIVSSVLDISRGNHWYQGLNKEVKSKLR